MHMFAISNQDITRKIETKECLACCQIVIADRRESLSAITYAYRVMIFFGIHMNMQPAFEAFYYQIIIDKRYSFFSR